MKCKASETKKHAKHISMQAHKHAKHDNTSNTRFSRLSYMIVTGICHHVFACSDLFRVDADDTETMSGSMVPAIILSTLVNRDAAVLVIAQFGTVLFVSNKNNCIRTGRGQSYYMIVICSL